MSGDEEYPEDIDFYRQKLADKEQEIADLQSSIKKSEFKTNREIKQAKIAEEHAKSQVRDEKLKSEKLNKRIFEVEEARKLSQKKLEKALQEKQQYQRESELIKAQYKEFKNEFKRIQRILPTQQFLDSYKLTLEGINSYEELYYSLSDKDMQCGKLEDAVAKLKVFCEETISDKEKIVAEIKLKKEEAEKLFKETSEKLHDMEGVLLKCQRELNERTETLALKEQLVEELREKIEDYKQEIGNYEKKVEQMEDKLTVEVNSREEEIKELAKSEYERYYNELKGLEHKYEENEKHLLANLQSIEQSLNTKVEQTCREKDRLEQQLTQAREELEAAKTRLREQTNLRTTLQKDVERMNAVQEQEHSSWEKSRQTVSEERQLLQKQLEALKKEEHELKSKLHDLEQEVTRLTDEKTSSAAELVQQASLLQQENQALIAEKCQLEDEVRNLKDQMAEMNSRSETKPTRSNSLHEIQEAIADHTNGKEPDVRKRQQSNSSIKFKAKMASKTESELSDTQLRELQSKMQQALANVLSLQEANTTAQKELKTQKEQYELRIQEQVTAIAQLKEVSDAYARRIDELVKEEEVSKYTIKKLNEDILEEKSLAEKSKAAFEKEIQYQKELYVEKGRQQDKIRETFEAMIVENKKLMAEIAKDNQEKLASQRKFKDLEGSLQAKDKELAELAKESKQKFELTAAEIERLQSAIAAGFARQKQSAEQLKVTKSTIEELQSSSASLKKQIVQLEVSIRQKDQNLLERYAEIEALTKQIISLKHQRQALVNTESNLKKQLEVQRKDKAPLLRVPSLRILHEPSEGDMDNSQYLQLSEKESEIYSLKQKLGQLQDQVRRLTFTQQEVRKHLQEECEGYIKQIIEMKMKVAETQMLAEQKVHHYNVMKKKYDQKFGTVK